MSVDFRLHPDLDRDCVAVMRLRLSALLLMNDATWPWLVLVPERPNKRDFHDLDPMDQYRLCDEISRCSEALQRLYHPHKINVAALGNRTPQLHVHVIARFKDDPAWPAPVWGKLPPAPYDSAELAVRLEALRGELKGVAGS